MKAFIIITIIIIMIKLLLFTQPAICSVLKYINRHRDDHDLEPLGEFLALSDIAQKHAEQMAKEVKVIRSGSNERQKQIPVNCVTAYGELFGFSYDRTNHAKDVVEKWKDEKHNN